MARDRMRLKWRMDGFDELRTAPGVREDLRRRADAIADACGEGFEVLPEQEPRTRAHLVVAPVTWKAVAQNRKRNVLVSNLDAGRL